MVAHFPGWVGYRHFNKKNGGLKLVLSAQTYTLSEVKNSYNSGEVTLCALEGLNPLAH